MKIKYTIFPIAILFLVVAFFAIYQRPADELRVGIIAALSGDLANLGEEAKNSTLLALNQINSEGGIKGQPVKVYIEDGKCSGKDAVSAANKLIEIDAVGAIFGGTCSGETLAVAPITEKNKVILFTSWALAPKVTYGNNFVFRNAPSDVGGANALAELAYKNGVRKMGIITESTDYNLGFEEVFSKKFKGLGGEVLISENFLTDNKDIKSIVSKNLSFPTDAILVNANGTNAGIVSKVIHDLNNKRPLYGSIFFADVNVLKNFGQYMEGGYTSEPANLDEKNPKVASFISAYEKEFKTKPQYLFWAAASYDAVKIYFDAVEEVGSDSNKIREYLYNNKNLDGVLGNYGFDENGDVVGIRFDNKQIVGGRLIILD
jgi:branched-chain amino acid transport system substrate-binding protein